MNSRRDFAIKLGRLGGVAIIVAAIPGRAKAQAGVSVRAELSESETVVGEGVVLQIEVSQQGSNPQARAGVPEIKALDGIEIQGRGTSFSTSSVFRNGHQSVVRSETHNFVILPSKPGKFSFNVQVPVGGQKFKPKRVPVLIVQGTAQATGGQSEQTPKQESEQVIVEDARQNPGAKPSSGKQEIILWPTVDRGQVYVGEQLIYRFEVWDRSSSSIEMAAMPTFKDFWTEELQAGGQRADNAGGHRYRVQTVLMRALFPQHSGKLVIGGAEARVSQSPLDALFGRRHRRRSRHQKIRGKNLAVEVLPLPADGQPPNFSANNVGKFQVTTKLDRDRVKQGEGLTLHVEIEGRGNIRVAELAAFPKIEGVRSYDPKAELPEFDVVDGQVGGRRSYKILLIAEKPGTITVPAHVLDFFDPTEKQYRRASSKVLQFEVEAREGEASDSPSEGSGSRQGDLGSLSDAARGNGGEAEDLYDGEVDPLAEAIDRVADDRVVPRRPWLSGRRWMAGMLAPPVLWASAWCGFVLYRKLGPSEAMRQRAQQRAKLEALRSRAKEALGEGTDFYPALAELLHRIAMEKAGAEGHGLPRHRLVELLLRKGLEKDQIAQWQAIMDRCDAARFAAVTEELSRRQEALERVEKLMSDRAWSVS